MAGAWAICINVEWHTAPRLTGEAGHAPTLVALLPPPLITLQESASGATLNNPEYLHGLYERQFSPLEETVRHGVCAVAIEPA